MPPDRHVRRGQGGNRGGHRAAGRWGPPDREAWARTLLAGLLPHYDADFDASAREISRAVEIFREEGDAFGFATSLAMLGTISALLGRGDEAMPQLDEAIAFAARDRPPRSRRLEPDAEGARLPLAEDITGARRNLELADSGSLSAPGCGSLARCIRPRLPRRGRSRSCGYSVRHCRNAPKPDGNPPMADRAHHRRRSPRPARVRVPRGRSRPLRRPADESRDSLRGARCC